MINNLIDNNSELEMSSATSETEVEVPIKMEITNINIMGEWKFKEDESNNSNSDDNENECSLCKRNFLELPPSNQVYDNITCVDIIPSLSVGKCNHMFHTYCIKSYLMGGKVTCPIDRTIWNHDKTLNSQFFVCLTNNLKPSINPVPINAHASVSTGVLPATTTNNININNVSSPKKSNSSIFPGPNTGSTATTAMSSTQSALFQNILNKVQKGSYGGTGKSTLF